MITFIAADYCMWPFNFQLAPSTRKKVTNGRTWMGLNVTAEEEQQWKATAEGGAFSSMARYLQVLARKMSGAPQSEHSDMVGAVSTKFIMADVIGQSTGVGWRWGKCGKEFSLRASKSSKRAGNGGDATLRGRYLRAWSNMAAPVAVGDNGWPAGCGKFRRSWWGSWRW